MKKRKHSPNLVRLIVLFLAAFCAFAFLAALIFPGARENPSVIPNEYLLFSFFGSVLIAALIEQNF